jgi:hypothetical protein
MKVFMSTCGWNGGIGAASSPIDGDATTQAKTAAATTPRKTPRRKRMLSISPGLHVIRPAW